VGYGPNDRWGIRPRPAYLCKSLVMPELILPDSPWFPLLIFVARIMDVSLGTLRIICITRGYRKLSVLFAFLEITIWVYAITSVVRHLDNFANVAAYAAGFATGNWVGMWIEQKLALGTQVMTLFSRGRAHAVAEGLRLADMAVTTLVGNGRDGPVSMCVAVLPRRGVHSVIKIAKNIDPDVQIAIADIRQTTFSRGGAACAGKTPLRFMGMPHLPKPVDQASAA
jgi:uncharacterized protein YebE (UPF0316 family)